MSAWPAPAQPQIRPASMRPASVRGPRLRAQSARDRRRTVHGAAAHTASPHGLGRRSPRPALARLACRARGPSARGPPARGPPPSRLPPRRPPAGAACTTGLTATAPAAGVRALASAPSAAAPPPRHRVTGAASAPCAAFDTACHARARSISVSAWRVRASGRGGVWRHAGGARRVRSRGGAACAPPARRRCRCPLCRLRSPATPSAHAAHTP